MGTSSKESSHILNSPMKTLKCVPDTDAQRKRSVTSDPTVTEHQPRTEVNGKLKREAEGVLKTDIADKSSVDSVLVITILPQCDTRARACLESPSPDGRPIWLNNHKVIDTVNVK